MKTDDLELIYSFEEFTIRADEKYVLLLEPPSYGRFFAIQCRSVEFPDRNYNEETFDGADVKQAAIIAAEVNVHGKWVWMYLSPLAKRYLGDIIFDHEDLKLDTWYYIQIIDQKDIDNHDR